jgi:predicted ATPase
MLKRLMLKNFKNFRDAELQLGPLTTIIGANATGKSNIRDAFRFLHAISRGYTLSEAIGEKWMEGGVLQWKGIRGGTRELTFNQADDFTVEVDFELPNSKAVIRYRIGVYINEKTFEPRVISERLSPPYTFSEPYYDSHPSGNDRVAEQGEANHLLLRMGKAGNQRRLGQKLSVMDMKPALTQVTDFPKLDSRANRNVTISSQRALSSMRFLDLNPEQMRLPSIPGQTVLGDQGENLSSVLQAICNNQNDKAVLLEWIKQLTPLDAADLAFRQDAAGRVLLVLVEGSGKSISAYSASDGTLRFLAIAAALLGPTPADFYFLEELDNGIHPTRLGLLLDLVQQQVTRSGIQVVATTHSPDFLTLLSESDLSYSSVVWRSDSNHEGRITQLADMPNIREVILEQSLGRLHASGWFEAVLNFGEAEAL